MPPEEIKGSPVNLTTRSEASTPVEEVSSDIARPTQASHGENLCQSPSEGITEQTDLFQSLQALTCTYLCCRLTPGCCTEYAQPADTLHCNALLLQSSYEMPVQSLCLRRWGSHRPSSALKVLPDVRRMHCPFTFFSSLSCLSVVTRETLSPWSRQSVNASYDATTAARGLIWKLDHFSRHDILDLQNDCLLACVRGTTTLCLHDMSMLAFTAAELKIVQSLRHWGYADHWEHYSHHGPILNVASLLYFLLLLPDDALRYMDRARLAWFVDMVLYYKYEAMRVLRYTFAFDHDASMLPEGMTLATNYTVRIEQLQRPALAYLICDIQKWFAGWQHRRSSKWMRMCAKACVRLRVALSPMIQRHADSRPASSLHKPLRLQPFVEQILL
jgi:hypothetical protein